MRARGFTLIETLLVIVIMGAMMAVAIPRLRSASVKRNLRGSRNTLVGLYGQARITAMQQGRSAELRFNGNHAFVTAAPRTLPGAGIYDTIGAVRDLQSEFGVAIATDLNPIVINAKGLTPHAGDVKVKVTRDAYADSILVSRYGRVYK